jgi:hypothetical protein
MQVSLNLATAPSPPTHTLSATRRQDSSIPAAGIPTDIAKTQALRPTRYNLHMLPHLMST